MALNLNGYSMNMFMTFYIIMHIVDISIRLLKQYYLLKCLHKHQYMCALLFNATIFYISNGSLSPRTYVGCYKDINLFFSKSKCKHLNSYAAIIKNHRKPILTLKILDALLMFFSNNNTVSALTESWLLDVGSVKDILCHIPDKDLVLGIMHRPHYYYNLSLLCEMFEDPFHSNSLWYCWRT